MESKEKQRLDLFLALWRAESPSMRELDAAMMWGMLSESGQDTILRLMRGGEEEQ